MTEVLYPALRGRFGDWAYYSVLMTLEQVASRVSYARDIHESERYSDWIQRELDGERRLQIAGYLRDNPDRFFNSLVVAVYQGDPEWLPFENVRPAHGEFNPAEMTDTAAYSLGYLRLTGEERLFALDGQHRLAGIKEAVEVDTDLGDDEISVIFVAHHSSPEGLRRTRKLFTTLNKTARPVKKGEVIALDESDVMAIIARRLVETHPWFSQDRVLFNGKTNLPRGDVRHLTTIENLYDVLTLLFTKVRSQQSLQTLRFYRPSDEDLESFYNWTTEFFGHLGDTFPIFGEYLCSDRGQEILAQERGPQGGHLLFRPVGLLILAEVLAAISPSVGWQAALEEFGRLPVQLSEAPFSNVIWSPQTGNIDPGKRPTARNMLLHMLGRFQRPVQVAKLRARYAELLGMPVEEVVLPEPVA